MGRRHGDPLLCVTTLQETDSTGQWLAENSDWDFTPSSTTASLFSQRRGLPCLAVLYPCGDHLPDGGMDATLPVPVELTGWQGHGAASTPA